MKKNTIIMAAVLVLLFIPEIALGKALNKDVRVTGSAKVTVKSTNNSAGQTKKQQTQKRASAKVRGGGDIGVGIMMGDVTGFSLKVWNGGGTAFGFGLGWDAGGRGDEDGEMFMQGDYLFHYFMDGTAPGQFGLHYGPGLRVVSSGEIGVRFPLGMDYIFQGNVADIFFEVAPTLNMTSTDDSYIAPEVGFRYYF